MEDMEDIMGDGRYYGRWKIMEDIMGDCNFFHEIRCCSPVLLLFHKGLILMLLCDVHFFLLKKPLPRQLRAMQTKGQTKATCKLTEIVHMCLTKDCIAFISIYIRLHLFRFERWSQVKCAVPLKFFTAVSSLDILLH